MRKLGLNKLKAGIYLAFAVVALLIMLDFLLPAPVHEFENFRVISTLEQHHNAGRNTYTAYSIGAGNHTFAVDESFAREVRPEDSIAFAVSRIFKAVNWYKKADAPNKSTHSLRIFSGLLIPLFTLLVMAISAKFKVKLATLVFVAQALLLADLAYLIW